MSAERPITIQHLQSTLGKVDASLKRANDILPRVGQIMGSVQERLFDQIEREKIKITDLPELTARATAAIPVIEERLRTKAIPKLTEKAENIRDILDKNSQTTLEIQALEASIQNVRASVEKGAPKSVLEMYERRLAEAKSRLSLASEEPEQPEKPKEAVPAQPELSAPQPPSEEEAKGSLEIQKASKYLEDIRARVKDNPKLAWMLEEAKREFAILTGAEYKPEEKESLPVITLDDATKTIQMGGKSIVLGRIGWEVFRSLAGTPNRKVPHTRIEHVAGRAGSQAKAAASNAIKIIRHKFAKNQLDCPIDSSGGRNQSFYTLRAKVVFLSKESMRTGLVSLPDGMEIKVGRLQSNAVAVLVKNYKLGIGTTASDLAIAMYGKDTQALRKKSIAMLFLIKGDLSRHGWQVNTTHFREHNTARASYMLSPIKQPEPYVETKGDDASRIEEEKTEPLDPMVVFALVINNIFENKACTLEDIKKSLQATCPHADTGSLGAESVVTAFDAGLARIYVENSTVALRNTWGPAEQKLFLRTTLLRQKLGQDKDQFLSAIRDKITPSEGAKA